jgi:hypothetical protein
MNVAGALNLFWAATALLGIGWLAVAEGRHRAGWRDRFRGAIAVWIAAVALFPSVSASDDLVRVGQMPVNQAAGAALQAISHDRSDTQPALYLARLSDALESSQISVVAWLLITLCFFALVHAAVQRNPERFAPSPKGRAPPRVLSFV